MARAIWQAASWSCASFPRSESFWFLRRLLGWALFWSEPKTALTQPVGYGVSDRRHSHEAFFWLSNCERLLVVPQRFGLLAGWIYRWSGLAPSWLALVQRPET